MKKAAEIMLIISSADTWCEQKKSKKKKNLCYEDFHGYVQLFLQHLCYTTYLLFFET